MLNQSNNNKRIAKNTIVLYIRLVFTMFVGLYTSRVVLETLGVEDYGVYSIVGGVVSMFSLLTSSLSIAIGRYITYELGRGNKEILIDIFSTSINIQIIMSLVIIFCGETIGLWFLNNYMNVPSDRMIAANWVLQCSLFSFCFSLISVPYNSLIIAHEKMTAFAYITIFSMILKLCIATSLYFVGGDKLITYALLLLLSSIIIRIIYGLYCKGNFDECKYIFHINRGLLKKMFSFTGWNVLGSGANLLNNQGVNILCNLFFGVTINAARGIAGQVEGVVQQFANNFTMAINPQIMKSYASNNLEYMHTLVYASARYSYYLLLIFAIPISLEAEMLLQLWLKNVPEYCVIFVRFSFLASLFVVVSNSLVASINSTGDIKRYQIVVSAICICNLPLTYLCFKLGYSPTSAYVVYSIIYFILIFTRLFLVANPIKLSIKKYIQEVILRVIIVSIIAFLPPFMVYISQNSSILRLVETCVVSLLSTILAIYSIGINASEKAFVKQRIKMII